MKSIEVTCSCCKGRGKVPLTGEYFTTYVRLRMHGIECTAAQLARDMDVNATAMSNRLAALERLGLATSRRWGRKRLFKANPEGVK